MINLKTANAIAMALLLAGCSLPDGKADSIDESAERSVSEERPLPDRTSETRRADRETPTAPVDRERYSNSVRKLVPDTTCGADKVTDYIGRKDTPAARREILSKSGATVARWIAPGQPVTDDLRVDRINVYIDEARTIRNIECV